LLLNYAGIKGTLGGLWLLVLEYGKAIPLEAWIGPEVSRRLRLPDFKIVGT